MKKLTFLLLMVLAGNLYAQTDLTFYNFRSVGQSSFLNPAQTSRQAFTLGILDSYNHLYLPGITAYDIFRNDETANQTLNKLSNDPAYHLRDIQLYNEINPLFLGFRLGKNYFSTGIQVILDHNLDLPKDIFSLINYGNTIGQTIELNDLKMNLTQYNALYLGYSREVNDKLSVGFRAKYLLGTYNAQMLNNTTTFKTDVGDVNPVRYTISTDYEIRAAGYERIEGIMNQNNLDPMATAKNYLNQPVGKGFGLDLGANYKLSNKLSVSASLLNLGSIKWNEGKIYGRTNTFVYEGFELDDPKKLGDTMQYLMDSIVSELKPQVIKDEAYSTKLNTKIYLGANYNLTNSTSLGLIAYGEIWKDKFRPGAAVSVTQRIWKAMDLRFNYNIYRDQYKNLGLGVAFNMGPVVLYTVTDNILGWAPLDGTLSLNSHYTNFRVGLNINVGNRFDRDNDGTPDRKDKCRKVPGPASLNGCPDTDGDGVSDNEDECLAVKGVAAAKGCPDADGDGVKDLADSCMNIKGLATLHGCPDRDNDGVADHLDNCPDDAGDPLRHGCPDKDGDGVLDKADQCPDDFGYSYTNGCPDIDKDSVADIADECPGVPGLVALKGCPDLDNDGIPNKDDECPAEAGPLATKGCPDRDNDGIADSKDACPDVAGTAEYQGCQPPAPSTEPVPQPENQGAKKPDNSKPKK